MRSILQFRHALLGPALDPVADAWIAVEDGVIVATGTGKAPSGAVKKHDGVAIPGLVDCHVHLALDGGFDTQAQALSLDRSTAESLVRVNAARHLDSGVTTVRDLGSPADVVLELTASGSLHGVAPRVLAAGAIASATGHGSFLATAAETLDEYRSALEGLADKGATVAKLFASGGVITAGTNPEATQMPIKLLVAVVREAHERGIDVAVHAHSSASIRNALTANVDTIEHFSYLGADEMRLLQSSASTLVSTYVATHRFVTSPNREQSNREALTKIIDHAPHERAALETAVAGGGRIGIGTDAGTTLNPHGWGMQEQAIHLSDAGMANAAVLRALTVDSAKAIGVQAGVLEPGAPADLVCLAADPLVDLRMLREITGVMLGGFWVRS